MLWETDDLWIPPSLHSLLSLVWKLPSSIWTDVLRTMARSLFPKRLQKLSLSLYEFSSFSLYWLPNYWVLTLSHHLGTWVESASCEPTSELTRYQLKCFCIHNDSRSFSACAATLSEAHLSFERGPKIRSTILDQDIEDFHEFDHILE